jgi:mono/diheme cytochrome c family protein
MFKTLSIVLAIGSIVGAQEVKRVRIQRTPATDGQAMFKEYCAVCHGEAGRGDGPAANALKKRPADLTQLARKNNGSFPELHVIGFVTGADVVAAHGTRDMPIWGDLFKSLDPNTAEVARLRVNNLMEYIKALQAQ